MLTFFRRFSTLGPLLYLACCECENRGVDHENDLVVAGFDGNGSSLVDSSEKRHLD